MTAGDRHSCALTHGVVMCWGSYKYGQSNIPDMGAEAYECCELGTNSGHFKGKGNANGNGNVREDQFNFDEESEEVESTGLGRKSKRVC